MQRLFGKELLVLLWAVEAPDVTPEEIAVAIRNWLGLKPEERWWLYTMTAAGDRAGASDAAWAGAARCGRRCASAPGPMPFTLARSPGAGHAGAARQRRVCAAETEETEPEEGRRARLFAARGLRPLREKFLEME